MLTRKNRFTHTVPVYIDLGGGQDLNIEVRKAARSYGNIKQLISTSKDVASKARQAADLKKQAANVEGDARLVLEAQANDLDMDMDENVEVLIDWMAGHGDHLAAIADWDYFEDDEHLQKVAITRQRIEEFEPAEIAKLAGAILQSLSVGEARGESLHVLSPQTDSTALSQTGTSN